MTAEESAGKSEKPAGRNRAAKAAAAAEAAERRAAAAAPVDTAADPVTVEPAAEASAPDVAEAAAEVVDALAAAASPETERAEAAQAEAEHAGAEPAEAAAADDPADEPAGVEAPPTAEEPVVAAAAAPNAAPSPELAHAELRIAALMAEAADLKDRLLRAAAEMENRARRAEREIADARQYAVTGFAREIVQVGDNLRRAIESVPPADQAERPPALGTLLEGIEATERVFLHVLTKHGVRRLEPRGEKFDANFHQAMFETEGGDAPPGTVTNVLQPGYAIGERVLRPALVSVAKSVKAKASGA